MHDKLEHIDGQHCPYCGAEQEELQAPWKCQQCGKNLKLALFPYRNMGRCTAIHAEERAIRSLGSRSAQGATLYVTTFPCFQCARYVLDAGIKKVVYVEAYPDVEAVSFLRKNGVQLQPFEGFKARAFNLVFKQVA